MAIFPYISIHNGSDMRSKISKFTTLPFGAEINANLIYNTVHLHQTYMKYIE